MPEPVAELPSFGSSLAVSLLSLGLVCLLAYVGLRWLARRLPRSQSAMRVLARHQLEPRRSLYVVEVVGRYFLLGSAETGLSLVAELGAGEIGPLRAEAGSDMAPPGSGLWAALRGRIQGGDRLQVPSARPPEEDDR